MHEATASYLTAAFAFLCTVILALIGYGVKAQLEAIRAGVDAQLEALRSEFKQSLSTAEVRFFDLVNGKYVRKDILDLRLAAMQSENCSSCVTRTVREARQRDARQQREELVSCH